MSTKKDPRRINLVVPYQAPPASKDPDASSSVSSLLPMIVMVSRNRYMGWGSVAFSIMSWLGESENTRQGSSPGYFNVAMSVMALVVTYIPIFMPPAGSQPAAAAAPVAVA